MRIAAFFPPVDTFNFETCSKIKKVKDIALDIQKYFENIEVQSKNF